jgi:hypothetical protein
MGVLGLVRQDKSRTEQSNIHICRLLLSKFRITIMDYTLFMSPTLEIICLSKRSERS